MSALSLEFKPSTAEGHAGRSDPPRLMALAVAIAGALAPWLLLVGAHGGLARSAAACFAGPLNF